MESAQTTQPIQSGDLEANLQEVGDNTTKKQVRHNTKNKQPVQDAVCTIWYYNLMYHINMIFGFLVNYLIIPAAIVVVFFIFIYVSKLVQYGFHDENKNHHHPNHNNTITPFDWHPNSINEGDIFWGMITCVCIGLFSILCALVCKCGR